MSPTEIAETFETMRQCFEKLGFNTFKDPVSAATGMPGVYLLAHERDTSLGITDDACWLRIHTTKSYPKGEMMLAVDFKAGPHFWLEVTQKMESQNVG